jgi:hypothetical protein
MSVYLCPHTQSIGSIPLASTVQYNTSGLGNEIQMAMGPFGLNTLVDTYQARYLFLHSAPKVLCPL